MNLKISLLATLTLGLASVAYSCLYFDNELDPDAFSETQREALLFRDHSDPEIVNLILKSGVQGQLPAELAWVFPLPSIPLEYKEVEAEIFQELRESFEDSYQVKGAGDLRSIPAPSESIVVHSKRVIGNYEITPIEILNETSGGGEELNSWLDNQGFIGLPEDIQKPYLKVGAVFLAIKLKTEGDQLDLKPLLVRYRSPEMRYPLRFTHDYRTFDLDLYVVHHNKQRPQGIPPELANNMARIRSMSSDVGSMLEFCPSLQKYLGQSPELVITRLPIRGVNVNFKTKELTRDPGL